LLEHEKKALDEVQIPYEKYWLPVQWASALLVQAREEGKISGDPTLCAVMEVRITSFSPLFFKRPRFVLSACELQVANNSLKNYNIMKEFK
jgi:hypothetical protein